MEQATVIYLLAINIIAFAAYGIDKWKAKHSKWRISEMTLIVLAFLGGALGALLGMRVFRHKTQHWKFKILVPLALVLWLVALTWLLYKTYQVELL